jgi:hypothetical protein
MPNTPRDHVLSNFDPHDVACAMEIYVRELDTRAVARTLAKASHRLPAYYRTVIAERLPAAGNDVPAKLDAASFERIVAESRNDDELRDALIECLRTNLRAIPLIGGSFAENIVRITRGEAPVSRGSHGMTRGTVVFATLAVALAIGAGGERVLERSGYRFAVIPPQASPSAGPRLSRTTVARVSARPRTPTPVTAPRALTAVQSRPTPANAPAPTSAPTPQVFVTAVPPQPRTHGTPPPGKGSVSVALPLVTAPPATPEPQIAPDLSDMPDATNTTTNPMPMPSAAGANVPAGVAVARPTPKPKHKPLIVRLVNGLNPFKPGKAPTPSATRTP